MKTSFYSYTFKDLQDLCAAQQLVPRSPTLMYSWYYKKNKRTLCEHHNLAKKTAQYISENFDFSLPQIHTVHESKDKTVKFLFSLSDGKQVESVLIPFQNKYTICLSSQVGCSMKCSFCYTGDQGFNRHLQTEEIVGQFLQAQQWLTTHRPNDARILNIVYMGQGEPLHNFDAVKKSAEIFISQNGLSVADHKITVSTSGYLPGLERWKQDMPDVNLALSLHSPFNDKRNSIIPINKRYPLEQILPLVDSIPKGKKRFVTYEYLVLKDFNDSEVDAHATGKILQGKKAYINLIPFNPYPGSRFLRPEPEIMDKFKAILDSYKIPTLIRTTKGDEILAACGQLNTKNTPLSLLQ
ncbi:MAG: 23S rRNA (adenine(2503)-C(2))-methyltransferase RlmN [Bdellovibrionaceae bacterium]|nr:23S rRNA (adenine(2503)-C(2))-methyltransferase RlmN [Pseudobdellovibrionaceae bacterium]